MPQQSSLQAPYQKSYLRQNAWDAYAQDSWRALPNLTLLFGLRYEYFSPYSEKYDRLSTLDTGNDFASVATVLSGGIGPYTGKYPRDLVYPEHNNFSPRLGIAVRAAKDTVVRAGYGINYAVGQYAKFIQDFAFQPPYADVQTNEYYCRCARSRWPMAFPRPQDDGQLRGQQVLPASLRAGMEHQCAAHPAPGHCAQHRLQRLQRHPAGHCRCARPLRHRIARVEFSMTTRTRLPSPITTR